MKSENIKTLLIVLLAFIASNAYCQEPGMALIPEGEFMMGKDMNGPSFSPAHKVRISAFYIDTYEVTNKDYLKFCKETGHKLPEFWNTENLKSGEAFLDYPVIGVNHGDASKYAAWAGKRLATEAEWEYAARGGLEGREFPCGNTWDRKKPQQAEGGWENHIKPVGSFEENGYGIHDMSGNVWEWVADRFSEVYYQHSPYNNPQGPVRGENRVIRGGSWHSGTMCKKVYYRKGLISNWSDFAVGFRCAKDIKE